LWRRPRHKLGCGAKERRSLTGSSEIETNALFYELLHSYTFLVFSRTMQSCDEFNTLLPDAYITSIPPFWGPLQPT
jgi:hypothetical protein